MFGNLGMWEVLILLFIVLLLFGAKRLPEIGGSLGKGIREFKSSLKEVEGEIRGTRGEIEGREDESSAAPEERTAQPEPRGEERRD